MSTAGIIENLSTTLGARLVDSRNEREYPRKMGGRMNSSDECDQKMTCKTRTDKALAFKCRSDPGKQIGAGV